MMTRRLHLAVAVEALPAMRYWLSLDETSAMPQGIRGGFELPIDLVHTASGTEIKAVTGWVTFEDGFHFSEVMKTLPASLKNFVHFDEGQSDISPDKKTFDDWITDKGLART